MRTENHGKSEAAEKVAKLHFCGAARENRWYGLRIKSAKKYRPINSRILWNWLFWPLPRFPRIQTIASPNAMLWGRARYAFDCVELSAIIRRYCIFARLRHKFPFASTLFSKARSLRSIRLGRIVSCFSTGGTSTSMGDNNYLHDINLHTAIVCCPK